MGDSCAAVSCFADVHMRLLAMRSDLDGMGLDTDMLCLPSHLFALFDGHDDPEVCLARTRNPLPPPWIRHQ